MCKHNWKEPYKMVCVHVIPDTCMYFVTQVFWTSCTTLESEMYSTVREDVIRKLHKVHKYWNFYEWTFVNQHNVGAWEELIKGGQKPNNRWGWENDMRQAAEKEMQKQACLLFDIYSEEHPLKLWFYFRIQETKALLLHYSYSHYLCLELQPH